MLVRGIRNGVDCTYEQNMAFMNARLNEDIETVCLFTLSLIHISKYATYEWGKEMVEATADFLVEYMKEFQKM